MRVIVDLEEKWVSAILVPDEQSKLIEGRIKLKNIGQAYEFDDEVEYCCPYCITVRLGLLPELVVKRYSPDGDLYPRLRLKFTDIKELKRITEILWRWCYNPRNVKKWEEAMIRKKSRMYHGACSPLVELDLAKIGWRLLRIAEALGLY